MQKNPLMKFFHKGKTVAGTVVVSVISMLVGAAPALAGIGIGVTPDFPDTVTVGQTNVPVGLNIQNTSTPDVGTTTVTSIFLTPSCGDTSVPCGTPDPDVFSVSASGTGSGACSGITFTITEVDPATGRLQFTPSSTLSLGLNAVCRIDFTVNVLKSPTIDVVGGLAGVQTAQIGQVNAVSGTGLPGSGSGTDVTTVNKAQSTTATEVHNASHTDITNSTTTPGTLVHDEATVTGSGPTPTGTVDFLLFSNATCSGSGSTFQAGVPLVAGVAETTATTTTVGSFAFKAHYNGDSAYNPSDGPCEPFFVSQLAPGVTTEVHNPNHVDITNTAVAAGTSVHDEVTVTGSGPTPTGTVDFLLFSNGTCSGSGSTFQSGVPLVAGVAESMSTTTPVGTFAFKAHYNGDSIYLPADGPCEPFTINQLTPTVVTQVHNPAHVDITNGTTTPGTLVHDNVTVSGSGPTPTGTVDFLFFTNGSCSGSGSTFQSGVALTGGMTESMNATTTVGSFAFKVHYNGDAVYTAADGVCEPFTVIAPPSVQGCSPGYWKQPQHFGSYPTGSGVYPDTLFVNVFGVNAFPGKTLLQVLSTGGGGLTALGRIMVGAYLNAATISGFPYTTAQVIADFQAAYASGNYEATKSKYEALQDPCPFGRNPGPSGPTAHLSSSAITNGKKK